MAVKRSLSVLNQQRLDVPDFKAIESAVRNDFDELISSFITEGTKSYVLRGFKINTTGAIGSSANALQLIVANSSIFHSTSNYSGTYYQVPSSEPNQTISSVTNSKVEGSFVPSSLNYIGFEYNRAVDNSTLGTRYFWVPAQKTEISKVVPLAEILNYKIVISSTGFASNVVPLAVIETDAANNVLSIEDRRPLMFRLGSSGATTPNPAYSYPWINRSENPNKTTSAASPFEGGDKQIANLKDWMDAIMSEFKDIKGTPFWYSANVGGSITNLKQDLANLVLTGSGTFSHDESVAGKINWSTDIFLDLIGSRLSYQILANASSSDITLQDNQVAYIKFTRGISIVPNLILTNGSATVTSVGAVSWTSSVMAGDFIKLGSELDTQYYEIQSVDSASQVTLVSTYQGTSTGIGGDQCKYAWGVFEAVSSPSTDRHIQVENREDVPFGEDYFWLFFRNDNGSATPTIYVRRSGGAAELEQGEEIEISDNTTINVMDYTGMQSESDSTPDYTNALGSSLASEETDITVPAAASITSGQYFTINSANDLQEFYVWYNKDGAGNDPAIIGKTPIEVVISTGDTNLIVASATSSAISAFSAFNTSVASNVVTVTNSSAGETTDAANVNVAGLTISVVTQGSGEANHFVVDDESLTKAIKRLDKAVFAASLTDSNSYDEPIYIINTAPSNDNELQYPVVSGTNITIPKDSRNSDFVKSYKVNDGTLEVFLNGQYLILGEHYNEVGSVGDESTEIEILFDLEVDDTLQFRINISKASGGSGGGGGSDTASNIGTGSNVFSSKIGNDFQFRRIQAGAGATVNQSGDSIVISATPSTANDNVVTVSGANYIATAANDVILVETAGAVRTVTLPSAAGNSGKKITIKKIDSDANGVLVASVSNQTIDLVDATATPNSDIASFGMSLTLISDNLNWWLI